MAQTDAKLNIKIQSLHGNHEFCSTLLDKYKPSLYAVILEDAMLTEGIKLQLHCNTKLN